MVSATCLLATKNVQAGQVLTPDQMKANLTSQDIKEATPIKEKESKTDDIGMPIKGKVQKRVMPKAAYSNINNYILQKNFKHSNINNYILQKNFKHSNIIQELHEFELFGYKTDDGLPTGVAVHYTANANNYSARSEADYEINGGWESAFVHTFVDAGTILNIHDTNYGAWGSGPVGNKYFVQFEMVTARNYEDFAKTTSYSAWYTAYLLHQYGLTPSLAQAHNGVGTVWSHSNITHYLGGTDHTDPDAYFASYGYDMNQFFSLVQHYYEQGNEYLIDRQNTDMVGRVNGGYQEYWLTESGMVKSRTSTSALANKSVTVTDWVKTTANKEYYLATVDGNAVAWIPKEAFTPTELVVERKNVNLEGTVNKKNPMYWLTNSGMQAAQQLTDGIADKTVAVTEWVKTNANKEYYLVSVNGQSIGWIPKAAFVEDQPVVQHTSVNLKGYINSSQPEYWLVNTGLRAAGTNTKNLVNKDVSVSEMVKTSANKEYYLISVNGKVEAWVPKAAFTENETVVESKDLALNGRINSKQSTYWLLDSGMRPSGETTSNLVNKNAAVTKWVRTSANKEYYLISVAGKIVGWVPTAAFAANETVTESKDITLNGRVNSGQSMYWLLDTGMRTSGENTNTLANRDVVVTKWVKTSANKEYYLVTIAGNIMGWIPKEAFITNETVVESSDVALKGRLNAGQSTYWLTDNGVHASGEKTDSLTNQDVVITRRIKTSANKEYYLVTIAGKIVAWVPKEVFIENESVVSRETVKIAGRVNAGQSTYWLLDSGIRVSGENTDSLANKDVVITERITTSANKEYYLVTVAGKVVAWIAKSSFVQQ
ncbi:hypothetical protein A4W75_06860 [Latilactobacillus curvatus]|nr:hypothetical protein A4W75_06860 [Latilactobacillus curvatus]